MRAASWTNVGHDVSGVITLDQILREAELDYTVTTEDVFTETGNKIPGVKATVKNISGQDKTIPIGVVSDKYKVCQNSDALSVLDGLYESGTGFIPRKAGETASGRIYVIGELPAVEVLNDKFVPHVILQTSHNGMYNLSATICPLRIVCQNQFAISFKRMQNTIRIQHSSKLPQKVAEAQQLLADVAVYMNGFTNTAEELALLHITDTDRYAIMDAFFDSVYRINQMQDEMSNRRRETIAVQKAFLEECYHADDNSNFRGTAWGIINATSDYVTHKPTKAKEENRFQTVTFDNKMMNLMMSIIRERVNS